MPDRATATEFGSPAGRTASRSASTERLDLDIVIVGTQKAGTSTLLKHLLSAPGVAHMHRPEISYFTHDDEHRRGGRAAIEKYFGGGVPRGTLKIGKTAGLLTSPVAMSRLLADSPRAQLVAVLRNPVDRAYSAYWFAKRRGHEPAKSFSEAVDRELSGRTLQMRRQGLREYIGRGEYAVHLERLYGEVDPQRVQVILFEDLRAKTRQLADEILEPFGRAIPAGASPPARANTSARARSERLARLTASSSSPVRRLLRPVLSPGVRKRIARTLVRYNETPFKPPPMDDEVRARLAEHYEPHNRRLETLIDRDLTGWDLPAG
jgi:hypothetical protein